MTLTEFSRDVVPVLQLLVTAVALFSVLLAWRQMSQTVRWNKLQAHHSFFRETPNRQLEKQVYEHAARIGVSIDRAVPPVDLGKIYADRDALFAVKAYLDEYEELCTAVNVGTVDEDLAFAIDSARVLKAYRVFDPFIRELRERLKNEELYVELEKVALRWSRLEEGRREARLRELERLGEGRGVRKKN